MWKEKNGYLRTKIGGKNILFHCLVWENNMGKIPDGYVVHHKDGDKSNNHFINLELMKKEEHRKLHGNKKSFWSFMYPTLKTLIERTGYEQKFIAMETRIPKSTISDLVARKYIPNKEYQRRLEKFFGKGIDF